MKLYLALSYSPISEMTNDFYFFSGVTHILLSYYVLGKKKNAKIPNIFNYKIFLDSGAFSAWKKKQIVDINKYCQFIKENLSQIEVYANLDVIGDPKKTDQNQKIIEEKGLSPLPVFHYGSPEEELQRLLNEYDYIALGGLVPLATNKKLLRSWLDFCFSRIKTKTKIHGFGVNSFWAWIKYPFYSVDATSWNQGSKYGRVVRLEGLKIKGSDKEKILPTWKRRTEVVIKEYNKAQKLATKIWEKRGVIWQR